MPFYFFGNLDTSQIFDNYSDTKNFISKKNKNNMILVPLNTYELCINLQHLYQLSIIDNQEFLFFWNPKKYVYMYTDASVLYKKDVQAAGYGFYIENNLYQSVGLQRDIEDDIQSDFIKNLFLKYHLTKKLDDSTKLKASELRDIIVSTFELIAVYKCLLEYSKLTQIFNQIPIVFTDSQFVAIQLMLYEFINLHPHINNRLDSIKFSFNKNLLKKTFNLVQKFNVKIIKIKSHVTEKPSSRKNLQYQKKFSDSSIDIFLNGNDIADKLAKHAMQIGIYQKKL